jgi:methyl-accepting chemotaxis protein
VRVDAARTFLQLADFEFDAGERKPNAQIFKKAENSVNAAAQGIFKPAKGDISEMKYYANEENGTPNPTPGFSTNWTHFLYAGLILLVCVAFYQGAQTENLLRTISSAQRDNAGLRKNLSDSDEEFRNSLARFDTELAALHEELADAQHQADASLEKARAATISADALASKLETRRRDEEKRQQRLSLELSQVERSTDETSLRLNGISTEVGGVKDTLDAVRADAKQGTEELQGTRADLSELKNGVATNSDQIRALRESGDKAIYEFTLTRMGGTQRVSDIQLRLIRTDEKHNTFTVEVGADDKLVEKRDKTINEPVQFFVMSKPSQPYELVVNEVGKNSVKGYIAAPKATIARN